MTSHVPDYIIGFSSCHHFMFVLLISPVTLVCIMHSFFLEQLNHKEKEIVTYGPYKCDYCSIFINHIGCRKPYEDRFFVNKDSNL